MIVLDSFIYDKIGKQAYGVTTTPFLDKLKEKSLNTTNLYSPGPFTEAAVISLLSGNDSLNEGGYMHNLNTKKNHYIDVFYENGYELYNIFYPYFMYSDEVLKKIDHQFFSYDFIFNSVYLNRLEYFISLSNIRELTNHEYEDIFKQLNITFTAWDNFLNYNENTKDKYQLIKKELINYDFSENRAKLKVEWIKYLHNPKDYFESLKKLKRNHPLFRITRVDAYDLVNRKIVNKLFYRNNKSFILKVIFLQFYYTLKNNNINWKKWWISFKSNIIEKRVSGYNKSVIFSLFVGNFTLKYKKHNFLKEMPSFGRQIELMMDTLKKRKTSEKPYMALIHPQDLHNRTSFFSYDTEHEELLLEELNRMKEYLNQVNNKFEGSLIYDFSVVYVDLCIKRLFESLKNYNLLENTVVVITADHGCSYVNAPIRDVFVNNFHTENYRIPLYIYEQSLSPCTLNYYYKSRDVLPTIYKICGIDAPNNISGKSIRDSDYVPDYAISEYMGGGCPDLRLRPIQYIIRDAKYLLACNLLLSEPFSKINIVEIYDLEKDRDEVFNLKNNSDFKLEKIHYLLKKIERRHCEIQNQYL